MTDNYQEREYERRLGEAKERMDDDRFRPETLRVCATMGSSSASMDVRFLDIGHTIGNTISNYKGPLTAIEEVMKRNIVEAMMMGYTEEQCQKREIVWLSINGHVVVDRGSVFNK